MKFKAIATGIYVPTTYAPLPELRWLNVRDYRRIVFLHVFNVPAACLPYRYRYCPYGADWDKIGGATIGPWQMPGRPVSSLDQKGEW